MEQRLKFLGIGMPKTGTRSLCEAMNILGFKSQHGINTTDYDSLNRFDFIDDSVVSFKYPEIDKKFKNLKYIYTIRPLKSWLGSCRHRFTGYKETITRRELFGAYRYNKKLWAEAYQKHATGVVEFFKDRPEDLLTIDIFSENKWKQLCNFLNVDKPDVDFPHLGKFRG